MVHDVTAISESVTPPYLKVLNIRFAMTSPEPQPPEESPPSNAAPPEEIDDNLKTLKYHLLGPSLTKAGLEKVDQGKVHNAACRFDKPC